MRQSPSCKRLESGELRPVREAGTHRSGQDEHADEHDGEHLRLPRMPAGHGRGQIEGRHRHRPAQLDPVRVELGIGLGTRHSREILRRLMLHVSESGRPTPQGQPRQTETSIVNEPPR